MKTYLNFKIFLFIIFILISLSSKAQSTTGIFGIHWDGATYHFTKLDPTTGVFTHLSPLILSSNGTNNSSATTNLNDEVFYYTNGQEIITFDINTGAFIDSSTIFPIATDEYFLNIRYNVCDSNLYGIINSTSYYLAKLAKLNPTTGQMTIISPVNVGFACGGCGTVIDPLNNIYYFDAGNNLVGVDLTTGLLVSNVTTINQNGGSFGHLVYDCSNKILFGLTANSATFEKYLSTVDPITGVVVNVSTQNNLNNYYWKPTFGDQTFDPKNGEFYFQSGPHTLVGVDATNGYANNVKTLSLGTSQYFECMSYYPQCSCSAILDVGDNSVKNNLLVYPNPVLNNLIIQLPENISEVEVRIFNLLGELEYSSTISKANSDMNVSFLARGIHIIEVRDGENTLRKKIIKQ
jgi:hypothetical protein